MALFRQGSGPYPAVVVPAGNGDHRPGSPFRIHDHFKADQKGYVGLVKSRSMKKRPGRSGRGRKCSFGAIGVILLVGVVVTIFGADYVFPLMRNLKAEVGVSSLPDLTNQDEWSVSKEDESVYQTKKEVKETARESFEFRQVNTGRESGSEAERASTFGQNGKSLPLDHDLDGDLDAEAKYWGSYDRRRDRQNIHTELEDTFEILARSDRSESESITDDIKVEEMKETKSRGENTFSAGLYNERGRKELRKYEKHFLDASLNEELRSSNHEYNFTTVRAYHGQKGSSLMELDIDSSGREESRSSRMSLGEDGSSKQELKDEFGERFEVDDDGDDPENSARNTHTVIDKNEFVDSRSDTDDDNMTSREASEDEDLDGSLYILTGDTTLRTGEDPRLVDFLREAQLYAHKTDPSLNLESGDRFEDNSDKKSKSYLWVRNKNSSNDIAGLVTEQLNQEEATTHDDDLSRTEEEDEEQVQQEQLPGKLKRKKKRTVPPCDISFLNSTKALREPTDNLGFESFSLTYRQREEKPADDPLWEPRFAGHQTLLKREESFVAKDQEDLHCGFVRGPKGYRGTGFEISKEDMDYLQTCHIAVSSCIFGNYDHIRNPSGKKVTSASKKKVCFAMFVDQPSLDGMKEEGEIPDENMNLGLWRVVLIKNVPYSDNRRTGKVPKFLTHRLFPNARYSVWLDSKLRLQSDPLLILEYFLWRGHHEYAISNHYDRHCVWEEVEQNKKLNKYNHSVIDEQFAFYQADGLRRFNASDPNKMLPSHVPEGSFIVRAHTSMSNLFSCLWFNEVERFTPRDQLSFAYTYMKLVRSNPDSRFRLNMFKDCERKAIAKLYRHKTEDALVRGRRH